MFHMTNAKMIRVEPFESCGSCGADFGPSSSYPWHLEDEDCRAIRPPVTPEAPETWGDVVRKYFPDATDKECDFLLWEKTCFPMGDREEIEEQLCQLAAERKLKEETM